MGLRTHTEWQHLQHLDESKPLYRKLWALHYRRALWAASSGYSYSMSNMAITVLISPAFMLLPLVISPIFGTYWAAFIAGMIRYEYAKDRFELIGVLPGGKVGAYRTIAALHMRRSRLYQHLDDALNITTLLGGIIVFLLFSGLLVGIVSPGMDDRESVGLILIFILNVTGVVVSLYIDQIQSVILAMIVGMVAPHHSSNPLEARLWGAVGYISIQLTLYSAAFGAGFGLLPMLFPAWPSPFSVAVTALVLFASRELLISRGHLYIIEALGAVGMRKESS